MLDVPAGDDKLAITSNGGGRPGAYELDLPLVVLRSDPSAWTEVAATCALPEKATAVSPDEDAS